MSSANVKWKEENPDGSSNSGNIYLSGTVYVIGIPQYTEEDGPCLMGHNLETR